MRPFPGRKNPENKRIFNYRLSRARRISENAFGLLAQRWHIYQRRLNMIPNNVEEVVKATVILHNFIQKDRQIGVVMDARGMPVGQIRPETENDDTNGLVAIHAVFRGNRSNSKILEIRNKLMDFFNSASGEVPWQYTIVRQEFS